VLGTSPGDTVTGFNADAPAGGGDLVDISDLLDTGSFAGTTLAEAIAGGFVDLSDAAGDAVVGVDVDGTSTFTTFVTLVGIDLGADSTALDDNIIVD